MAPAVAFVLTLLLHRVSGRLMRRLAAPFAAYLFIALLAAFMTRGGLGQAYEPHAVEMINDMATAGAGFSYGLSVLTQTYFYFKYLVLWIVPNVSWMSIDMREPLATTWQAWPYAFTALLFIAYPIVAMAMVMRRGRIGMAGWLLASPWLMFATELSTVRVQEPFVLYRAYLWFPLFGALLPLALIRLNVKVIGILGVAVVCVLVPLSWNRLHSMSKPLLLWDDAARLLERGDEPGAGRIYFNRAQALLEQGRNAEALSDLDRVVKLNPDLAPIHLTRAQAYFALHRYAESLQEIDRVIKLTPQRADAYYGRATVLKRLGREEDAILDLRRSCDLKHFIGCYALGQRSVTGRGTTTIKDITIQVPLNTSRILR